MLRVTCTVVHPRGRCSATQIPNSIYTWRVPRVRHPRPRVVDVAFVIVVHVAIVQVVHMSAVTDRDMTTIGAVVVGVTFVRSVRHLDLLLLINSTIQYLMDCWSDQAAKSVSTTPYRPPRGSWEFPCYSSNLTEGRLWKANDQELEGLVKDFISRSA